MNSRRSSPAPRATDKTPLKHLSISGAWSIEPLDYLEKTMHAPDRIVRSRTDAGVELYYRHFGTIPVTSKYLCVVAKTSVASPFIITFYFTDAVKQGEVLWTRR